MPGCLFPKAVTNAESITPIDFVNPQAEEMTNDLRLRPVVNTRRVAPVDLINPQILNPVQTKNEYFCNLLNQQSVSRETIAKNNKLGLGSSNPLDLYADTNNLPFDFFPPQYSNFFLPMVSAQMNRNNLITNLIPREDQFPNTFVNLNNQESLNKSVIWRAKNKIKHREKGINLAHLSFTPLLNVINEKSEEQKNVVYYRKKSRKQLDEFFYQYEDDVAQTDSCIVRTKLEKQVYAICTTYDQTRDIDAFFFSLINLPLLSVIRSQRWVINKILDVFESANSEVHSSLFLKIFPKKIPINSKIQNSSRKYYNMFGYIAKLCNYESTIRAYNLYTPIIFEQQNGKDIVSALQSDDFTGKKTKLLILNQIYKEALEYQKKGEIPTKTRFVSKNDIENWLRSQPISLRNKGGYTSPQ